MESLLENATSVTILGLVVYVLVKDVIVPLIGKKSPGYNDHDVHRKILDSLNMVRGQLSAIADELTEQHQWHGADQVGARRSEGQVSDMHGWQSPDSSGRQDWRGARALEMMAEQNKILVQLVREMREGGKSEAP